MSAEGSALPLGPQDSEDELPPVIGERFRDVLVDIAQTEKEA